MPHPDQSPQGFPLFSVFLGVFALGVIGAGFVYLSRPAPALDEAARAEVAARLRPAGAVHAGAAGAAAVAAAQAERRAQMQAAASGPPDGQKVYSSLCSACHATGAGGAPKLEHAAWDARVAQGMEVLVSHAINGFQGASGVMPPRGGGASLSDAEVEAAVKWMVDNLK